MAALPLDHDPHPASLRRHVEQWLSAAIVSGELAPGTLLTVPTLAVQFGVSATPVREAILDLEKRGFVQSLRNKGFRVTEVSAADLAELVAVRQLLECPAAEQLAGHLSAAERARLQALADRIVAGARTGDLGDYLLADQEFHLTLIRLTGNRLLESIVADLRSRTRLVGLSEMLATQHLLDSALEHQQLIELLDSGDAKAAGELLHRHIGHTLGWWSGLPEPIPEPMPGGSR